MANILHRFFGLEDADDDIYRLAKIMSLLMPVFAITFMLSSTFFMIFVAEALGGGDFIQGLGLVGTLVVISLVVQTLLDYPTGALADYIGQRFVIASAFLTYAVTYFLIAMVTSSTPFTLLVLIYALQGFAGSQQSGALSAWFDNNYQSAVDGDEDRKQYGVFQGRTGMLFQVTSALILIPGSVLAVIWGRAWVFQIQGVMSIVLVLVVLKVVKDLPGVREEKRKTGLPSMSEYTDLLKGGVSYLFKEPWVKYVIIGSTLAGSTIMVYGNLILFPLYFSYLITDVAVSSFRTVLFVPGVVTGERSGIWSRRFEPKKWIPRFRFLQAAGFVFYLLFAGMMYFFPPPVGPSPAIDLVIPFTSFILMSVPLASIIPMIIMVVTYTITLMFAAFAGILTQREMIDVIPNEIRNSMYSLQPTIAMLFAIPQIGLFGWLIPVIGFPTTLVIIGFVSLMGVLIIRHGLNQPKPVMAKKDVAKKEAAVETVEVTE